MEIKLTWHIDNDDLDSIRIYRSDTEFDLEDLPDPLDEISGDSTEYVDDTVDPDKIYHYLVNTVRDGEEVVGTPKAYIFITGSGFGNNSIIRGEPHRVALMDVFGVDEFITPSWLAEKCGLKTGEMMYNNNENLKWIKVMHRGVVKIFPSLPLVRNVSWDQLYNLGLVFGTEDGGPIPELTVPQNTKVVIDNVSYKVRLFRCGPEGQGTFPTIDNGFSTDTVGVMDEIGEIWSSVGYMYRNMIKPFPSVLSNEDFSVVRVGGASYVIICAERYVNNNGVLQSTSLARSFHSSGLSVTTTNVNTPNNNFWWMPVLELVG